MLLTITTTRKPATDLAVLLHKSAQRCQTTPLNFGKTRVFYPVATHSKCTVAFLLDIDPIEIIRTKGRSKDAMPLEQYVNDRPYVASSFLSVAIAQTLGSALNGKCKSRPDLVNEIFPLTVEINVVLAKGGSTMIERLFKPLGYKIKLKKYALDEKFPEWGESNLFTVELKNKLTIKDLLTHLYVLLPVLDNKKHYFVGDEELEKLLKHGGSWLAQHPDKEIITQRYLKHLSSLANEALERLNEGVDQDVEENETPAQMAEQVVEEQRGLNAERHGTVLAVLKSYQAGTVLDVGCAEGRFLNLLLKERQFKRIVGMDVSIKSLEKASEKLRMDRLPTMQKERISLIHGSLMYRDKRLNGFDAVTVIEVIEHLEPYRLAAFERVMFGAQPKLVVVTTPNVEYNVMWEKLPQGEFRHLDHRFEWTRQQFQDWAKRIANQYNYDVRFLPIGPEDAKVGSPTQMGIFTTKI